MTPDLSSRLEAAARAYCQQICAAQGDALCPCNDGWKAELPFLEPAIRAAFPELFTDPPSAWLAPWEATPSMREAGCTFSGTIGETEKMFRAALAMQDFEPRVIWNSMRDAHLNLPPKDEEQDG